MGIYTVRRCGNVSGPDLMDAVDYQPSQQIEEALPGHPWFGQVWFRELCLQPHQSS